jgi:hypothetical protein
VRPGIQKRDSGSIFLSRKKACQDRHKKQENTGHLFFHGRFLPLPYLRGKAEAFILNIRNAQSGQNSRLWLQ